jgi:hypothetical protein
MPELDPTTLWLGLIFSGIGFVAFRYGRKMELLPPTLIGLVLMVYPWFVSRPLWLLLIGLGLTAALWLVRE